MALAPPVRVTLYWVFAASLALGLRTHRLPVGFVTTAATGPDPAGVTRRTVNVVVDTPVTASLNLAEMLIPRATPVAFATGVRPATVGATLVAPAVVKVQLVVASGAPARSR